MSKAPLILSTILSLALSGALLNAQEVPAIDDECVPSISSNIYRAMDLLDLAREICMQADDNGSQECKGYEQMRSDIGEVIETQFRSIVPDNRP